MYIHIYSIGGIVYIYSIDILMVVFLLGKLVSVKQQ